MKWQPKLLLFIPFGLLLNSQIAQMPIPTQKGVLSVSEPNHAEVIQAPKNGQISPNLVPVAPLPSFVETAIKHLAICESKGNEHAYNPHDTNGLESIGKWQFQRKSWTYFVRLYGLFPDTEDAELQNLIWDGYAQEVVVRHMWLHGVNFNQQFPTCWRIVQNS